MARFRKPPKPASMALNLAPMVDVMMCLIIFFLLASRLVSAEHRPVKLPFAEAAEAIEKGELGNRCVISVRLSLEDVQRAEYIVQLWDGQRIADRVLGSDQIADYLRVRAAQAADRGETLRCVIRADKDVSYGHVETVLRGCGLAKISKIVFGANTGHDPEAPK